MIKRAVLYARVSYDDRDTEGRNLAGQLEMGREYANDRGFLVVAELSEDDRGASGAAFELEQLNRIREMARAGEFEVLVVREIDRLSRSLAKQLIVEEELKRGGVQIEYVLGEYPDTPEGNLMKNVRASIAEYERLKIAERNSRGRRLKVKAGNVIVYGRPPYGYRLSKVNGKTFLVIHEPEAEIVRQIFAWYLRGDGQSGPLSMYAISHRLTEARIPSYCDAPGAIVKKRAEYGVWVRSSVSGILHNETYAGVWYYSKGKKVNGVQTANPKDEWLTVEVPVIVSREDWDAAQKQSQENRRNCRRNTIHTYLLQRRVFCGSCHTRMFATMGPDKKYPYYRCPVVYDKDRLVKCRMPGFRGDWVDALVWEWLRALLSDPAELASGLAKLQEQQEQENSPLRDRMGVVEDLIANNRQQLARLLDLYLGGEFPKDMLVERKARLEATIQALEKEGDALASRLEARTLTPEQVMSIQRFAAEIAEGLEEAETDLEAKRRILDMLEVQVTLTIEDGKKWAWASCVLAGEERLSIESSTS